MFLSAKLVFLVCLGLCLADESVNEILIDPVPTTAFPEVDITTRAVTHPAEPAEVTPVSNDLIVPVDHPHNVPEDAESRESAISSCRTLNPGTLFSFGHETNHGCRLNCYTIGRLDVFTAHNKNNTTPCLSSSGSSTAYCVNGFCYDPDTRENSTTSCRQSTGDQNAVALKEVGLLGVGNPPGLFPDCSVKCYVASTNELQNAPIREGENCQTVLSLLSGLVCRDGNCRVSRSIFQLVP